MRLNACEGTALLFQAHANYRTWSIDFGKDKEIKSNNLVNYNFPKLIKLNRGK